MISKLLGTKRPTSNYTRVLSTAFLVLASASATYAQSTLPPRPADPYADPAHDIYNPLRYIASNALTSIAFGMSDSVMMAG